MELREFFLVTLPGLEDLALAEVREWFPQWEAQLEHGGVVVRAPLGDGLAMNQALKIPTRILVRISSFIARDFPKLFNRVSSVNWREWVDPSCDLKAHASTSRSRLKIKKRIEETAEKAWRAYQKEQKITSRTSPQADLFLRLQDNTCVLSLDTSGERLHKRGVRTHVGEAPLRETIAAALLQLMRRHAPDGGEVELVDPMMGSGVFLLEALTIDSPLDRRHFAFENFAEHPSLVPRKSAALQAARFARLIGFERDSKALEAARHNLNAIQTAVSFELHHRDVLEAEPLADSSRSRWVINNPPYGERLKIAEPLNDYYARLFQAAEKLARPTLACFLLPARASGRLDLPATWKVLEKRRFSNGGIPVVAFVFGRQGIVREGNRRGTQRADTDASGPEAPRKSLED